MAAPRPASLSLVIPVYNERDSLEALHDECVQALGGLGIAWEMILVDDGSDDGSGPLLDRLAAADARLRVLHFAANAGQSAAFFAGFRAARGEVVVTLDSDLQNDPADIPMLLEALGDHGAVAGWRRERHDRALRRISSRIANSVRNLLTAERVRDTGCSLKAFRREALATLPLSRGMHRFLPTYVRMAGYTVTEVPVRHRPRRAGVSKYGIGNRLWVGIGDLFMVRWMQRRAARYRVAREVGAGLPPHGGS